ncbi:glycoside hydrolase family 28 protein, partial [Athelia psychrophila]
MLRTTHLALLVLLLGTSISQTVAIGYGKLCDLKPLGAGWDDTDQVESAISRCGKYGLTTLATGNYNITRKMTWDLSYSRVDLHGYLNFQPDIDYWMQNSSTYRVVNIQNQASWFIVTGNDFIIDAHNTGGIDGNGQPWWEYFTTVPRLDGDGRPISLTLSHVTRGVVQDFRIVSPPFWANTVSDSTDVVYDGMYVNATNTNATFAGQNIVPNTDGIDTYRAKNVQLLNWDITCGDDSIAIKGNSSNIAIKNLVVRGGNGIAFGSLGQYVQFNDLVENVSIENATLLRLPSSVQPNLNNGVYFKSFDGNSTGLPPTAGGGGGGYCRDITLKDFKLHNVSVPTQIYQSNDGHTGDTPSYLKFSNISYINWSGTTAGKALVKIACSANARCGGISF